MTPLPPDAPGPSATNASRFRDRLPHTAGHLLHLRSRALARTSVSLTVMALTAGVLLGRLSTGPHDDPGARAPLTVIFPVLMAAAIGVCLHSHSPDADRTASRRWWPLRSGHLLTLTALASVLMALSVPGDPAQFGAPAMVRNTIGATGVTALFSTVLGARLSWLPMFAYGGVALLLGPRRPGGAEAVWLWLTQPGFQTAAWCTAVTALAAGVTAHALRGPLRTDDHR